MLWAQIPVDAGLTGRAGFGQWNVSKWDASRGLKGACMVLLESRAPTVYHEENKGKGPEPNVQPPSAKVQSPRSTVIRVDGKTPSVGAACYAVIVDQCF